MQSELLNQIRTELISKVVHYAAIAVLFIDALHVDCGAKELHGVPQVNRFRFAVPAQLEADEVTFAEVPVYV